MRPVGRAESARIGQNGKHFKTPLKGCALMRAFDWYNARVDPSLPSKVIAKLLKSSHVRILPISGIAMDLSVTHRVAIISLAIMLVNYCT